jgi:ankyrin repeat protein
MDALEKLKEDEQVEQMREFLNKPDSVGNAPLFHAINSARPALVKWLLQHGADPNTPIKTKEGAMTPVSAAICSAQPEVALLLLQHGAKPAYPALHFACNIGAADVAADLIDRGAALEV